MTNTFTIDGNSNRSSIILESNNGVVNSICHKCNNSVNCNTAQKNMHTADAICLTCIDFRLIDDTVNQMNKIGYLNNYDEFILAGSSLGYNGLTVGSTTFSNWAQIFYDHIDIAIALHDISQIILIDHMNCGAYKIQYDIELGGDIEYNKHVENLNIAKNTLSIKYPTLIIKGYIISIDGCTFTSIF